MAVCDQLVVCQAALLFIAARWIFSLIFNLFSGYLGFSSPGTSSATSCCSPSSNLKIITGNMTLTTLGNIKLGEVDLSCAVCLNKLRKNSQVWELINCSHVFHKNCLEQWVSYDKRLSCPLCRASLLPMKPNSQSDPTSWVVERVFYFFGDDLLL